MKKWIGVSADGSGTGGEEESERNRRKPASEQVAFLEFVTQLTDSEFKLNYLLKQKTLVSGWAASESLAKASFTSASAKDIKRETTQALNPDDFVSQV